MNPEHLGGPALIPCGPLQRPLDEFLLKVRYGLFQQNSPFDHQPDHRFQLLFHVGTLRGQGCRQPEFEAARPERAKTEKINSKTRRRPEPRVAEGAAFS